MSERRAGSARTNSEDVLDVVVEALRQSIPAAPELDESTELLRSGLLDSIAIVDVLDRLEQYCGCELPRELLVPESFADARALTQVVLRACGEPSQRSSSTMPASGDGDDSKAGATPRAHEPLLRRRNRRYAAGVTLDEPLLRPEQRARVPVHFNWTKVEAQARLPLHSHDQIEVWIVLRGSGRLTYDGLERDLTVGDMVYFEPGVPHEFVNLGQQPLHLISIYW